MKTIDWLIVPLIMVLSSIALHLNAQITITGTVTSQNQGTAIPDVNLFLQDTKGVYVYASGISDANGKFNLSYTGKHDSLLVLVTGFNVSATRRVIAAKSQYISIDVQQQDINIKEVTIKQQPVERRQDTIKYIVASYIASNDRSIGDVLKKMPGIEVERSGEIKYNGVPISNFYIEGLDMLQGRYGIATQNIRASDIGMVEVLERHQPIKLFENMTLSDKTALNLKLKESSRNIWSLASQAGGGYKPKMWCADLTAMNFSRNFQSMGIYKTNNAGNNVVNEAVTHYQQSEETPTRTGVAEPILPDINERYFLRNNIHYATINAIIGDPSKWQITVNGLYSHDNQLLEGQSETKYYAPSNNIILVKESIGANKTLNNGSIALGLKRNSPKIYLKGWLKANGQWQSNRGTALNNTDTIYQHANTPLLLFDNGLNAIVRLGDSFLEFQSTAVIHTANSNLAITFLPSVDLLGTSAQQTLNENWAKTAHSISYKHHIARWMLSAQAEVNTTSHKLSSLLNSETTLTADSLQNKYRWQKFGVSLTPTVEYRVRNIFSMLLNAPVERVEITTNNRIQQAWYNDKRTLFSPQFRLQANLSYSVKLNAAASYQESIGAHNNSYSGYIMNVYNSIHANCERIDHIAQQNYLVALRYDNTPKSLFSNISISYRVIDRELIESISVNRQLISVEQLPVPNTSKGVTVSGYISKRFDGIYTLVSLGALYNHSTGVVARQNSLSEIHSDTWSSKISASTRIAHNVLVEYAARGNLSRLRYEHSSMLPIYGLQQTAKLTYSAKQLVVSINGESYYSSNSLANGNSFFLNAQLGYSTKRINYRMELVNLLNTRTYSSAYTTSATSYVYTYALRPLSVLFVVGFRIV